MCAAWWDEEDRAEVTVHPAGPSQFGVDGAERACTSIDLALLVWLGRKWAGESMRDLPWLPIVRAGARWFSCAKGSQVAAKVYASSAAMRRALEFKEEMTGDMRYAENERMRQRTEAGDGYVPTMRDAVGRCVAPMGGGVFTGNGASVLLFFDRETRPWIYDSHGGGGAGTAALFECASLEAAAQKLEDLMRYEHYTVFVAAPKGAESTEDG
jgi:hypothetical protein